jgi:hypothetical protein
MADGHGLRSDDFYEQQMQQASRARAEAGNGQATVPGREAASWGADVGPADGAKQRAARMAKAQQMYDANTRWIDQSIICLYFQSQQQSYMVNKHNREHPESAVQTDPTGDWQEAPIYNENDPDDPHEGLCEYEIERLSRVRENAAMIASLGIRPMSETQVI